MKGSKVNLTDYGYDLNTATRRAETRIETHVPNIYLQISTVHHNGFFASSLERIKIENGFISIKIAPIDSMTQTQHQFPGCHSSLATLKGTLAIFMNATLSQLLKIFLLMLSSGRNASSI